MSRPRVSARAAEERARGRAGPEWIRGWAQIAVALEQGVDVLNQGYAELAAAAATDSDAVFEAAQRFPAWWAHVYRLPAKRSFQLSLAGFFLLCPSATIVLTPAGISESLARLARRQPTLIDRAFVSGTDAMKLAAFAPLIGHLRAALAGRTMYGLLERAKRGDLSCLSLVVRVDPCVLLVPPLRNVLVAASLCRHRHVLNCLSSALRSPLPFGRREYSTPRLVLILMHQSRQLDRLDRASATAIFSETARLYRGTAPSDASASDRSAALWRNILNWKREIEKNPVDIFSLT